MNPDYSWKDSTQIDPSFSRATENDYVVAAVSPSRANVEHSIVTSPINMKKSSLLENHANSGISTSDTSDPPNPRGLVIPEKEKTGSAGRRIVSTTKRAAQNRNAQKAFRQRRDKYVKELEATAAEVAELHKTIEELRQENLQLRDYTLALQSRLIELSPNVTVGSVAHPQSQEFNKL